MAFYGRYMQDIQILIRSETDFGIDLVDFFKCQRLGRLFRCLFICFLHFFLFPPF